MTQQMLSLEEARTLTPEAVIAMTDEEAEATFRRLRWPDTGGCPVCPNCGGMKPYFLKPRGTFKCRMCGKHFSMTAGTLFTHRKMPIRVYLLAIALFYSDPKGQSALRLSHELDVQYRTAYSLADRMRLLAQGAG